MEGWGNVIPANAGMTDCGGVRAMTEPRHSGRSAAQSRNPYARGLSGKHMMNVSAFFRGLWDMDSSVRWNDGVGVTSRIWVLCRHLLLFLFLRLLLFYMPSRLQWIFPVFCCCLRVKA